MKRRKAVSALLLGMGGALVAPGILFSSCSSGNINKESLTTEDIAILDEIGETILPATASSPGAKAAQIGTFMKVYVTDCYSKENQNVFIDGIAKLNKLSNETYKSDFMQLDSKRRHDLIVSLDLEADKYNRAKKEDEPVHYFSMMKNITLIGYFSSETGATKALRYVQVPGSYNGSFPYKKGDKAWAT